MKWLPDNIPIIIDSDELPTATMSKICKKCGIEKPLDDYFNHAGKADGKQVSCKVCLTQINKEWIKNNPQKRYEMGRRWRKSNKGKILFYQYKHRYSYAKRSAKQRGILFELTREQYEKIVSQPCFYCGDLASVETNVASTYIDRIDSNKDYTLDNVRACCKYCNFMKSDFTEEKFYSQVKQIYAYRGLDARVGN